MLVYNVSGSSLVQGCSYVINVCLLHIHVGLSLAVISRTSSFRISETVYNCITPRICEDDGLACLPNQEIKETNAQEQNFSAFRKQECLNSREIQIPQNQASLAGKHTDHGALLLSIRDDKSHRHRKSRYLN